MKYTVKGQVWNVRRPDGSTVEQCAPDVHFHTAAGLLRWALKKRVLRHGIGGRPYPTRFDDKYLGREDGNAGRDYHLVDTFSNYVITSEHLSAMRRAQARYTEIIHYLREVDPEWVPDTSVSPTGLACPADNSEEMHEVSLKYGIKRHRMVLAPSGDACF